VRLLWLWTSKGRSGGDKADEMTQEPRELRKVSRAHEEICGRPEGPDSTASNHPKSQTSQLLGSYGGRNNDKIHVPGAVNQRLGP
jgi:hypothetical protein